MIMNIEWRDFCEIQAICLSVRHGSKEGLGFNTLFKVLSEQHLEQVSHQKWFAECIFWAITRSRHAVESLAGSSTLWEITYLHDPVYSVYRGDLAQVKPQLPQTIDLFFKVGDTQWSKRDIPHSMPLHLLIHYGSSTYLYLPHDGHY